MTEVTLQQGTRAAFKASLSEVMKEHGITNAMAAPRISKVCLNMGVGRAIQDGQILNVVSEHLSRLAGQRACITRARKSVAQFRSREGNKIGAKVTLRGQRMWSFLDRLIHIAIPRIKDFRGISPKSFDAAGNYNLGLREQAIFPEVTLDRLEHNQGLNITICFENSDPDKSLAVLKAMKMPFRER